jgi:hypothetical protein
MIPAKLTTLILVLCVVLPTGLIAAEIHDTGTAGSRIPDMKVYNSMDSLVSADTMASGRVTFGKLFNNHGPSSIKAERFGKMSDIKDGVVVAAASHLMVTLAAGFSVLTLIPAMILTSFYHTLYTTEAVFAGMVTSWGLFGFFSLASIVFTIIWMIYLSMNDNAWAMPLLITEIVITSVSALSSAIGMSAIYGNVQLTSVLTGMIASWVTFSLMCVAVPIIMIGMVFYYAAGKEMFMSKDELAIGFRL